MLQPLTSQAQFLSNLLINVTSISVTVAENLKFFAKSNSIHVCKLEVIAQSPFFEC